MNDYEKAAWSQLIELGAKLTELGGCDALDVSTVRVRNKDTMGRLTKALREVVGRSGQNEWHINRNGEPIFVIARVKP